MSGQTSQVPSGKKPITAFRLQSGNERNYAKEGSKSEAVRRRLVVGSWESLKPDRVICRTLHGYRSLVSVENVG